MPTPLPTPNQIENNLRNFFIAGEHSYKNLIGICDVTPTMCDVYFIVKNNRTLQDLKAKCNIILFRGQGWILNDIIILKIDGSIYKYWYNLTRPL